MPPSWQSYLVEKARKDPAWWITSVLGDSLWSKQREIAKALVDHERVAVPAAFGCGKTFIAARLALHFLYNFRPSRVITTAPTARQVKDLLWAELRTAHKTSRKHLGGQPLTLQLKLDDQQFAVGFSTKDYNIDYFTGYHSPNQFVVFDQAAGLPKTFWEGGEALMTSSNCRWLAIGNTAISDCEFANICMPERSSKFGIWHQIKITAEESPNVVAGRDIYPGLISHDWVERRRAAWGTTDPLYRIFVLAEFVPEAEMTVIPYSFQLEALERCGEIDEAEGLEIGLDVATRGLDNSVWLTRCGSAALHGERVTGNDEMQVAGHTVDYVKRMEDKFQLPVTAIKVDVIGVGGGVFSRLAELELPVIPVNNSEGATDSERYHNVRAEMAWSFRTRFDNGMVGFKDLQSPDPDYTEKLAEDIRVQKYKITSTGKIQLRDKDEMRLDLGRSPDWWDSAVMAFEWPGGGVPTITVLGSDPDGNIHAEESTQKQVHDMLNKQVPDDDDFDDQF